MNRILNEGDSLCSLGMWREVGLRGKGLRRSWKKQEQSLPDSKQENRDFSSTPAKN